MMNVAKFEELAEEVLRPGGLVLTAWLIEMAEFLPGMKVVDLGCGTGITVEYLQARYSVAATGIDLSKERLALGLKRMPQLPLFYASAETTPFADASLDGVLAECSLSVMDNLDKVLEEANRVLVMNGKLCVSDLYTTSCAAREMTFASWKSLLSRHGFRVIYWQDQLKFLKSFVAGFIMKHGSASELWQCLERRQGCLHSDISYFSLVAVKGKDGKVDN